MFEEDDIVKWSSQAGGHIREKEGRVVGIVPVDHVPNFGGWHVFELGGIPGIDGYELMFNGFIGRRRESYLVLIDEKRLYWPRVKWLEKVKEER